MKSKIKSFLSVKQNILLILIDIFLSFVLTIFVLKFNVTRSGIISANNEMNFSIWLFFLIIIFITFIFSHFIYKIKDIYNFIYKKRYILALIILILLVLGKFNGSSIGKWNDYIEPNSDMSSATIIGRNRDIRSDEWLVNTPFAISQKYVDYSYYNNIPRATKTDMFSSIFVPVKDILILGRPFNIGYILFGEEYGLSLYWYGRLILLLLVTFELMMIISNKKKIISLMGAVIIAGSPVISWFYSNYIVDLMISGQLCILIFNLFLITKNNKIKILLSIALALAFNWFALTLYPAWQVPLGYMFALLAIWVFAKNIKENNNIKDYKFLLITIIIICLFIGRYLYIGLDTIRVIMSTAYPGKRILLGGGGLINNFVYPLSIYFPISNHMNPCEASGIYCLFPIPIITSIVYLLRNKKEKNIDNNKEHILIIMLLSLLIIFVLYTAFELPKFIVSLTLLKMSAPNRIVPIIGIICTYLLVLTIGKFKVEKMSTKIILLVISIISSIIIVLIGRVNNIDYCTIKKFIGSLIILTITIYLYLTSSKKFNCTLFIILMISLGLENIALVNPVNIGTNVMHDKPLAKEIVKIVKEDKNAKWITLDSFVLQNYPLASGAKVINSTNIYPNIKLWNEFFKTKKYEEIYNRYAHIIITLTDDLSSIELVQPDTFKLYLNKNDINKLKVKYIMTDKEITELENTVIKYHNDNIWIYEYTG